MLRVLGAIVAIVVLVAAPIALVSGVTDTLDEQVNAAVDARNDAMDEVMVDEVEETVDEMEEEPEVFDPGDFMEDPDTADSDQDLATYDVDGDEISNLQVTEGLTGEQAEIAEDTEAHERVWDLFSRITDAEHEPLIDTFVVFSDGFQNILAAVEPQPPDYTSWTVYIDGADLEDEGELVLTLAHEYAHILTLETSQVEFSETLEPECGELVVVPDYGCAVAGSYWEAYNPFWAPLEEEHAAIDELATSGDEQEYYDALGTFYEEHQDEFVTDYAVTSQAEDMAESFSYWMVDDDPQYTGVAQEKIDFWDQFPELVALREQARENLGLD
jgi:hypothetical protein